MYLTSEEEKMLRSDNETVAKCMEILVTLGKFFDAERLVEIKSAHVSGVSYENIGDAGLAWLKSFNAKVRVPTTINPAGMDVRRWQEMGIDREFWEKQMEVIEVFHRLGASVVLTCTPYYLKTPEFGDHIAWAESSAAIYANSVIGARTNRESSISALAAAITGRTPYYGLHIKENRAPTVVVKVSGDLSAAGYLIGSELGNEIPYIVFERTVSKWELKLLSAAMAASGGIAMFHAEGITPESKEFEKPRERVEVEGKISRECEPDLVAIGCPHVSDEELKLILDLMKNRRARREFWIFAARSVAERNREVVRKLEELGAKVFCDTCMVVSPASEKFECIMVNSGKALEYLPKLRKVNVAFGDLASCVEMAVK